MIFGNNTIKYFNAIDYMLHCRIFVIRCLVSNNPYDTNYHLFIIHVFPFILSISFPLLNFTFDLEVFLGLQIKRIYFILDTYASWNCPLVRFMFQSFDDQMRSFLWSNCCVLSPYTIWEEVTCEIILCTITWWKNVKRINSK